MDIVDHFVLQTGFAPLATGLLAKLTRCQSRNGSNSLGKGADAGEKDSQGQGDPAGQGAHGARRADPELVGEVLDVMKELATSGMTMIVVTHEMGFTREVADSIAFMDGGVGVESGPPRVLLGNPQQERTKTFMPRCSEGRANSIAAGKETLLVQFMVQLLQSCSEYLDVTDTRFLEVIKDGDDPAKVADDAPSCAGADVRPTAPQAQQAFRLTLL
jgi:hypothetical protein